MKHKEIYEDLMTRILAEVEDIVYVDWFNEQLLSLEEGEDDELPFNRPAVLIQFQNSPAATYGNKKQLGAIAIRLLLITETLEEPNSLETAPARQRALDHTRISQALVTALLGYNTSNFNSLSHTGTEEDHDFRALKGTWLTFTTVVSNKKAQPETGPGVADIKIVQKCL